MHRHWHRRDRDHRNLELCVIVNECARAQRRRGGGEEGQRESGSERASEKARERRRREEEREFAWSRARRGEFRAPPPGEGGGGWGEREQDCVHGRVRLHKHIRVVYAYRETAVVRTHI